MITYQLTNSKAVAAIAYDEAKQTMFVKFTDSPVYAYHNVNQTVVEQFVKAPSKGRFFHQNIKDQYQSTRLDN